MVFKLNYSMSSDSIMSINRQTVSILKNLTKTGTEMITKKRNTPSVGK